jgi:hypothetical protein
MPATKPKPKQVKRPAMKWFVEQKPRVPFTKVLAQFPQIPKKEIEILKHGGAYTDISKNRKKGAVTADISARYFWNKQYRVQGNHVFDPSEKLKKRWDAEIGNPIFMHTHPCPDGRAQVSFPDIRKALHFYFGSGHRAERYIALVVDEKGNEMGRTFYNLSNKTYGAGNRVWQEKGGHSEEDALQRDLAAKIKELKIKYKDSLNKIAKEYLNSTPPEIKRKNRANIKKELQEYYEQVLKIKFRFVPMPGYRYNKELMRFEKIK